jgi:dTDP-4-amino-4,6-dideoxygalactose transaminase
MNHIPFNRPYLTGRETEYIHDAVARAHLSGDGAFTARCREWLIENTGAHDCLLVHSCTAALEMSAMLLDVGPGDEVIMPSFTFVSTANAFVLRGARPVFVDVRPDTFNLDEERVAEAITPRTKALVPIHYAGVGCDMHALGDLASEHGLAIIEDAAQGLCASYHARPLGTFGALGTLSFHETKNVTCGEGGALLVNDPELIERAEIVREKGTNRSRFFRGQVDKYTWVDVGSSYVLSDLAAAFLWAQLEEADAITRARLQIWERYDEAFAPLEHAGLLQRPVVPLGCEHNAHMYYLVLGDLETRTAFIRELAARDINAVFHYVPLHSSPAGLEHCRTSGALPVTEDVGNRLVRIPLWAGMAVEEVDRVIDAVLEVVPAVTATRPRGRRFSQSVDRQRAVAEDAFEHAVERGRGRSVHPID